MDIWLGRLWQARFRVGADYIPRLVAALVMSAVNTVITLPERVLVPLLMRNVKVKPPVFILGTHRSGTTLLHNLLSLDTQYCTPRAFHILNPVGCLFTGWLTTPLLGIFLPGKRPMDGVRFHLFAPQEEEFALASSCEMSVYWGMTFPKQWPEYDRYIYPEQLSHEEQQRWRKAYAFFMKKVAYWSGRRLLSKNPHNTSRMGILSEMYPGAKFVHIRRHPEVVYQSNLHLSEQAHVMCQIQDSDPETSYAARFMDNYLGMEDAA